MNYEFNLLNHVGVVAKIVSAAVVAAHEGDDNTLSGPTGRGVKTDICWDLNFTNNTNFLSLEVVDRGSETQLQVTENLNCIGQCSKG